MHCIEVWVQSEASQQKCPMCRQPFKERVADAATEPSAEVAEGSAGNAAG